ncbi:phage terminase large subunit [Nitrosomonas sp.]|uniref:phage terminase large subunit n=1 Tax=Nitrosomonas sp. TaxID=42353 RepID=UPI002613F9BC|nr:phage terminase large subunit [Nitrosomonas sp.]MCW5601813.1 phage terminase large subunit [Nitrosomonas sp.]
MPRPDQLAPWQAKAMAVPESYDLALTGGRGGGKTHLLAALFLRHCEQYQNQARCLVIRKTFPGLVDLESELRSYFFQIYGKSASFDGQKHRFTFPNGSTIQLDQLERESDFEKYQGKSYTYVAIDECGQYASPALIDRLRSSLRGPIGVPTRMIILANPGGPGHHWIAKRHALQASWIPYTDGATDATFVTISSTYRDNRFIDRDRYAKNLQAACSTDPELAKAWLNGDWSVMRGAYFSYVIDESRNMIEPWPKLPSQRNGWQFFLAHDFGSSAPSITYLCAESPGTRGPDDRYYPKDSIILFDELALAHVDDPSKGLGLTVPAQAERILSMCVHWKVPANGVADDAIFSKTGSESGSIADEFRRCGVKFTGATKGRRLHGWQKMARMLADAGKPDMPGLYVSRSCRYWWETVPSLARDPRNPEDVDSRGIDHAADACRYGLTRQVFVIHTGIGSAR